ncbi:hypothetical protein SAMN05444397_102296 [Flavobacterium aquidurense]|uniref:Uncharacterized protein n=1 Tax=Flavobacterium frigidimaris TaxID=262320 RepID=A0ABX4BQM0_FLAFR|nr:hypothetical protein [Flavobacterium frigidimaris]OXA79060.1 hypothetical protein B0A65_10955 [Flavobacterium frigidimaris]SDY80460.1 hypothetical protein SAMN05444397_102296 [Flavobacterium aquidurense]
MIEIHQAIFGEGRDLGHAVLNSSYQTDLITNQISGYTDLVDRPTNGKLQTAIIRGFVVKDNFLLIKSFPDHEGRPGRVFSHALVLSLENFLKVKDITDLLQFHLKEINKSANLNVIQYTNYISLPNVLQSERMIVATNAMINHIDNNNTIAWIENEEYWLWISLIWSKIPDKVKINSRIGAAFNSKFLNVENLNLVYIPEGLKPNWLKECCAIIDVENIVVLETSLIRYFNNVENIGSGLNILLKELDPTIEEIDDLKILNEYTELYQNLNKKKSFTELLIFCDLVSKYCPEPKIAILGKKKIIDTLASNLLTASYEDILFLQYQTWKGYELTYLEKSLGQSLKKWLNSHIQFGCDIKKISSILTTGLTAKLKYWWHDFIYDFITEKLINWHSDYSKILWSCIEKEPSITNVLVPLLNDSAEKDLIEELPKLNKVNGEIVLQTIKNKKWYSLYGIISIELYGSKEAFTKILAIPDLQHDIVLEKMSSKVHDHQIITDSLALCDDRLTSLATKMIIEKPDLKAKLIVSDNVSQKLWLQSIDMGLNVWKGVSNPNKILFEIMNLLIKNSPFDEVLLSKISSSDFNSLKNFEKRILLWDILPSTCKEQFIEATLFDCLKDIDSNKSNFNDLEKSLKDTMKSSIIRTKILSSSLFSTSLKLNLVQICTDFNEIDARLVLTNFKLSPENAITLGSIASTKHWRELANSIFNLRHSRNDLAIALKYCYHLLSFWDRLSLPNNDLHKSSTFIDEFWNALLEKATELYPDGPNQNGLWENSGGQRSDLHITGSGKQIWSYAISHMKSGGRPSSKDLLQKMIDDFSCDESLKTLKNII